MFMFLHVFLFLYVFVLVLLVVVVGAVAVAAAVGSCRRRRRRRRCLCGYRPEPRRAGVFSSNCCVPSLPAFDMLRMLTCCKYLHVQMLSHVHLLGVGGDGVVY